MRPISFGLAKILEHDFRSEISALDLISLPNYHIYLKLMIEGKEPRGFSRRDDSCVNSAKSSF
jgi:hypothetical protein